MYKEYKATEGYYLLSLEDFGYGKEVFCNMDNNPSLIEVTMEDAVEFNTAYNSGIEAIISSGTEDIEEAIQSLKDSLLEGLTSKGYDITKLVEPIIIN